MVRLRPAYPFILALVVWQTVSFSMQTFSGNKMASVMFPYLGDIVFRAWELITGPLISAIKVSPSTGFEGQVHALFFFENLLGF
jgi:hypothetical protein